MSNDSLMSGVIIGHAHYAPHTLVHSPWENHPDDQDKSSFKLGGHALHFQMDCPNP